MTQELSGDNRNGNDLKNPDALRKWAGIVYLCQVLSLALGGLPLLVGIVINYVKRAEVEGTWLESHFSWQIATFWYTFVLVLAGLFSFGFLIGYLLLVFAGIFLVYRVFLGWSRWNVDQAMEKRLI